MKVGVKYKGIINYSLKLNSGRTISFQTKNNGTEILKMLFAKMLIGQSVFDLIPIYLDAGFYQDTTWVSKLSNKVLLSNKKIVQNTDSTSAYYNFYSASFDAMISNSVINQTVQTGDLYLKMTSQSGLDVVVTKCLVDGNPVTDISQLISQGKNLVVNWQMNLLDDATPTLSKMFSNTLIGNVIEEIPMFSDLGDYESDVWVSNFKILPLLTGRKIVTDTTFNASFDSVFTKDMLNSHTPSSELYLRLLTQNQENLIELKLSINSSDVTDIADLVDDGKNFIVNWVITLLNEGE